MSIDYARPRDWDATYPKPKTEYVDPYDAPPKEDWVNNPAHYNTGSIECIDYLADSLGDGFSHYLEGSIKKYLHRFRYKKKPVEDLRKARWYLDRLIAEQIKPVK